MKKFLINLLILLSSPIYIFAVIIVATLNFLNITIISWIKAAINFMKSDYMEVYKISKKKFKK